MRKPRPPGWPWGNQKKYNLVLTRAATMIGKCVMEGWMGMTKYSVERWERKRS